MTDNGSPADANAASDPVEEFPSKLRVHALARVLGVTSRQVLAHLAELGSHTRSPQSSIERDMAEAVAQRVRDPEAADGAPEPTDNAPDTTDSAPDTADSAQSDVDSAPEVTDSAPEATDSAQSDVDSAPEATDSAQSDVVSAPEVTDSAQSDVVSAPEVTDSAQPDVDSAPEVTDSAQPDVDSVPEPAAMTLFSAADAASHEPVVVTEVADGPLFLQPSAPEATGSGGSGRRRTASAPTESWSKTDTSPTTDSSPKTESSADQADADADASSDDSDDAGSGESGRNRRRRRGRRGRGRGRGDQGERSDSGDDSTSSEDSDDTSVAASDDDASEDNADAASGGGKKSKKGDKKGKKSDAKKDEAAKDGATKSAATKDSDTDAAGAAEDTESDESTESDDDDADASVPTSKRRRRRRRRKGGGEPDEASPDDPPNTVVHEREPRSKRVRDEVQGISGSTRLEAKRQRRRDGRDAGRRRPPILSESEFLARRESVERVMVVRERSANSALTGSDHSDHSVIEDYTQVAVLEDGVLVEHFVTTETSSSMVGNIYLGRVQNVLPGMEAAFVDIGRGRNGVLYAGEVNWDAAGLDGGSRKIEQALKPGDNVVVQVSKDPVGHKGARLTTQISLAGRYLVYVPGGSSTGISRKLPDVERKRLKQVLAKLVPDDAGVIIRTASEGVSAEDLGTDIERLESKWKSIDASVADAKKSNGSAGPRALYEEPDLLVRVVRDLFNEDFRKLVIEGNKAWSLVEGYVQTVAPDLLDRVERFERTHADAPDSFTVHRIDEQLAKALDRKVWLPSGGTLIIEHTEAMTVIDVNTGKFTGSGGNLEETVTRNNLEAAEEIVRQMRLRDIGGMIIVDFIDMVLESNRDLVLRRLTESLARDRTRHQVSEVTSLGLVQMTRKRLGTGLLEAFSTTCTSCGGRGVIVHSSPVEVKTEDTGRGDTSGSKRSRRGKRKNDQPAETPAKPAHNPAEHPMFRAMAAHAHDDDVEPVSVEQNADDQTPPEHNAADRGTDAGVTTVADESHDDAVEVDGAGSDGSGGAPPAPTDTPEVEAAEVHTNGANGAASGTQAASGQRRPRRRAARRAASPTTTEAPTMIRAETTAAPLTTFGPISTSPTEAVVAVRRRPRRRAAGRPAGPPVED
ncbi:translation initiation factor IF-2 N-terminal domain-containing protein [Gordonia sp. VNK1]|uniref:translation initiation factor IF-2 N-terminal domain-containing protein n=1 Tax=Gordonia oleivorans TaxID=3156618 RepID=UPI0032B5B05D